MTISFIAGWYFRLTPICFMNTSAEVLVSKANSVSNFIFGTFMK